ncbi:N-acylglucosamine 2-epimerase [Catalinimonas alkaloidigena]|uniref:AGE family epimerase/isomerase n=1 Tax=Catalinimonas alkaloidigena TaxID=1075417 RepID=UPI002406C581|nr:AGE family epimerase/isomerase [Catalinimonas alkaloidigena]MDF9797585.1 N-acylglucosamine 2-epimerase [Catalinimonas alkaloidigena]
MNEQAYASLYANTLLQDVIPFWMQHSGDASYGGYLTCLDRKGKTFDTDKFIWLQCRQVWCFSMLYNRVEQKQEWLDFALQGAEFLKKFGRDAQGNWYFSLTREGKPLVQPYNIFSDCFAAMAFGQLSQATQDKAHSEIAIHTYHNILKRQENPKGSYNKAFPGTRPLQSFALPMIMCNLILEMEHLLAPEEVDRIIQHGSRTVMDTFYQPDSGQILENVNEDGSFSDTFEGRLLNPGHALEAMWFIIDLAARTSDQPLIRKAVDISLNTLEYSWDRRYGGIFYFMDIKGHPPQALEWDQKLWWVHMETLISLLKGFLQTGDQRCWQWFEKVHDYCWTHFADPEYGEWYGYLNRRGEVLIPQKGGKWKGCFHVPRGLYQCWQTLDSIAEKSSTVTPQ